MHLYSTFWVCKALLHVLCWCCPYKVPVTWESIIIPILHVVSWALTCVELSPHQKWIVITYFSVFWDMGSTAEGAAGDPHPLKGWHDPRWGHNKPLSFHSQCGHWDPGISHSHKHLQWFKPYLRVWKMLLMCNGAICFHCYDFLYFLHLLLSAALSPQREKYCKQTVYHIKTKEEAIIDS